MQILNLLINDDTFKVATIDEITHDEKLCDFMVIHDHCSIEKALDEVKYVPSYVVRLEKFYDLQDKFNTVPNCKTNISCLSYETVNLGTKDNPQTVNLGTECTHLEKSMFIKLFKEYKYAFAWTYDDINNFNPKFMHHIITMK